MPEFSEDILEVIPENEIPASCDVVARELPISSYTYGFMTTCYERRKINPAYDVTFYRHRNNRESGIFVVILKTGNKTFGLLSYACKGYEELFKYTLVNTSKINWKGRPLVQGVLPRHYSILENVMKMKKFQPKLYVDSTIRVLSIEKALNLQIEELHDEVHIRQLTFEDIDSIYNLWPHKDVWTIDEIISSIRFGISFGVFSKETKEIQAWIMYTHYGALGMLYTLENCRRLGYAKVLVVLMSKELAKMAITPFASIMDINIKSISLFNSLGYQKVTDIKYFNVCDENK